VSTLNDLVQAQGRSSEADIEWLHHLLGRWFSPNQPCTIAATASLTGQFSVVEDRLVYWCTKSLTVDRGSRMSTKPLGVSGPTITVSSSAANGLVAIALAFLLPPVGIFFARHARDSTRAWGGDDTMASFALWISVAFTVMGAIVVIVGFTTSVVVPLLSTL
jgi:hypothetical protein